MNTRYKLGDIVLSNWKLKRLLGEGSYGNVYEAEREDFDTVYKAAIKIITIPKSNSEVMSYRAEGMNEADVTAYFHDVVREIVKEFALMAQLKGTANVVSYEDHTVIQHEGGVGWDIIIRMELLTSLIDYTVEKAFTQRDVVKIGIDMCKALALCQKFKIVHRDIKLENIFISDLGDYKLGDFGIARTVEKTAGDLTNKRGTYSYMAPEIYKGDTYGASVDIYSLGLVLYRLLNDNRAPFLPYYPAQMTHSDRETALMKRISGEKLPLPRMADGRLAEIILKACAYDPKDRYTSPLQMKEELEEVLYNHAKLPVIYPQNDEIAAQDEKTVYEPATFPKENNVVEDATVREPMNFSKEDIENEPTAFQPIGVVVSGLSEDPLNQASSETLNEMSNSVPDEKLDEVLDEIFGETSSEKADPVSDELFDEVQDEELDESEQAIWKNKKFKKGMLALAGILILGILIGIISCQSASEDIPVTAITNVEDVISLYIGDSYRLNPGHEPEEALVEKIEYFSDNPDIAMVSEYGEIVATSLGRATITIALGGLERTVEIVVAEPVVEVVEPEPEVVEPEPQEVYEPTPPPPPPPAQCRHNWVNVGTPLAAHPHQQQQRCTLCGATRNVNSGASFADCSICNPPPPPPPNIFCIEHGTFNCTVCN